VCTVRSTAPRPPIVQVTRHPRQQTSLAMHGNGIATDYSKRRSPRDKQFAPHRRANVSAGSSPGLCEFGLRDAMVSLVPRTRRSARRSVIRPVLPSIPQQQRARPRSSRVLASVDLTNLMRLRQACCRHHSCNHSARLTAARANGLGFCLIRTLAKVCCLETSLYGWRCRRSAARPISMRS
jgi:hypothetical protein